MVFMIMLDTSFLIALAQGKDENHERADALAKEFDERTIVSDHVLLEFVTHLARRDGGENAYMAGQKLLSSDADMICIGRDDLGEALDVMKKYSLGSFADASSIVIMRKLGVKKIASFDSDFDRVAGVERIC